MAASFSERHKSSAGKNQKSAEFQIDMESKIKGLAKGLVQEVIKADMSMHAGQIEAWTWMNKHVPVGDEIPREIFQGFPESRYLAMNEVSFKVHLKPLPVQSIWQRLRLGFRVVFGKSTYQNQQSNAFEFCSASDKNAQGMEILIKRFENGKIKADYLPFDPKTEEIMQS